MAPRCFRNQAGMGDGLREERVPDERLGPGLLADIDVGLAGVTGGVDQETGPGFAQEVEQEIVAGVIQIFAGEGGEGLPAFAQGFGEGLPDVTRGAEKNDHPFEVESEAEDWAAAFSSRIASAITVSR